MIAFYLWDTASDAVTWAGGCHDSAGSPVGDMPRTMEGWKRWIEPADRPHVESAWRRFVDDHVPFHLEYSIRRGEGDPRPVRNDAAYVGPTTVVGAVACVSAVSFQEVVLRRLGDAGLGALAVDPGGTIRFANDAAARIFGYQTDELVGASVDRLVPDAIRERHESLRNGYFAEPVPRMMAGRGLTGRRKDGASVPVAIGLYPIDDDSSRVLCTLLDLSDVVTARDDLARFFELSPDLFCIADFRGYFRRVNRNFERILGYSEEELLARPFLDFVHPDDRAATVRQMHAMREGHDVIQFRNRYRDHAGSYRWFEWTARPAPDADVTFAVARDVTDRIAIETRLHSREQREKALLDSIATPIHVRDRDGRFEFCNRGFTDAFGLSAASVIGRVPRDVCPRPLADFFERGDADVFQSGQAVTSEGVVPGPQGPRNFVMSRIPLFDRDGAVAGAASVSTDITEQMRAREAERQMEMARTVQQKLYPARAPSIPGFQVAGAARPVTQLCGDYYDYVPRHDGRCCVVVGDVSGHGLGPALQMVELRALLRTLLRRTEDLTEILEEVNNELCQDLPESMFISLFLVELDPSRRRVRFVSAGHPAWLLAAGREPRMLHSTGPVLGLLPEATFGPDSGWIDLRAGDVLLLSTDGVVEAATAERELFGKRRLQDAISRNRRLDAAGILDALFADVDGFVDGHPVKDDMTVVVVKAS